MTKTRPTRRTAASALGPLLVACVLAIGCGDGDKTGAAGSAAPAPPGGPALSAGAGADKAAPVPTTTAPAVVAEPAPSSAGSAAPSGVPYERAALLAYLPTECPDGRAYVDVQKILGGDGGAMGSLVEALVSAKDKAKAEVVLKTLRDGGLDPSTSIREVAACVLAGKQPLVAFGMDTSRSKDATQTLLAALQAGEGTQKVTLVDQDGMKVIKNPRGDVMAMVAPNVLILAKTVDRLKESAKAPGGTAAFADAPAHVLWFRLTGRERVDVSVAEKGSDYDLVGLFPPTGPMVTKMKTDPNAVAESYKKEALQRSGQLAGSPLAGLIPVLKEAKWSTEGDRVKVNAKAAQSLVVDTIKIALATTQLSQALK